MHILAQTSTGAASMGSKLADAASKGGWQPRLIAGGVVALVVIFVIVVKLRREE